MNITANITIKRTFAAWAAAVAAALCLVACSADDPTANAYGSPVTVRLRLAAAPAAPTRAWDGSQSAPTAGEGMDSWAVVVADNSGTVVKVLANDGLGDIYSDNIGKLTLPAGTYTFYSFANIDMASIGSPEEGKPCPDFDAMAFGVSGNTLTPPDGGIPMSNSQTIEIGAATQTVELWVVRMLAKMELRLTNATASDLTVTGVTLDGVTQNAVGNLMLLPKPAGGGETGACSPNIAEGAAAGNHTWEQTVAVPAGAEEPATLVFYVNESLTPANAHGLFTLTLALKRDGGEEDEMRYALITNDDGNWNYIGRNDHRVIPVTLDDYRLDLTPYDFPPIGVYPASVKEEDGLFTCTFHAGGHFHLVPQVMRYSTGQALAYGSGSGQWQYAGWTTDGNPAIYTGGTATADQPDNGGAPAWVEESRCIIGKMEETATGRAYHTLTVSVGGTGGQAARTLSYRICIIKE